MQSQTLQQGDTIATPSAATTPAQVSAAKSAGWSPSPTTTTVDATQVGSTVSPAAAVATPTTNGSAYNTLSATVTPAPVDQDEQTRSELSSMLTDTEENDNPGAYELGQDNAVGLNNALSAKNSIDDQVNQTAMNYDAKLQQMRENPPPGVGGADWQKQIQDVEQQKTDDLAVLSIKQSVATGNYTQLQDTVTKMVSAYTGQQDARVKALQSSIDNIDADPSEKEAMSERLASYTANVQAVKTAGQQVLTNAAQNGAPPSVLAKIGAALKDPNATEDSVFAAAGNYAKDPKVTSDLALQASETAKNNADAAVEAGSLTPQQSTAVNAANSQLDGNPTVKAFQVTASEYANIQNIPENTTDPVQDLSLMTSMAHLLSPGSNSLRGVLQIFKPDELQSGAWDTLNGIVKEFDKKGDLSPQSIDSLKTLASTMYQTQATNYTQTRQAFVDTLSARGVQGADSLVTNYDNVGVSQPASATSTTKSGKAFDYQNAIKAGYTDAQIQAFISSN